MEGRNNKKDNKTEIINKIKELVSELKYFAGSTTKLGLCALAVIFFIIIAIGWLIQLIQGSADFTFIKDRTADLLAVILIAIFPYHDQRLKELKIRERELQFKKSVLKFLEKQK